MRYKNIYGDTCEFFINFYCNRILWYNYGGVSMKNKPKMENKKNNLKVLGYLFVSMLLLFVAIASAEENDETYVASAGAQAIATGSETIAYAQVTITSDEAYASATSKAKAENGGTATAMAEAWANWADGSSACARSVATAIAEIGETIWAEATAHASVSSGEAISYAGACVGDAGCIDPKDEGNSGDVNNGGTDGTITIPEPIKPELDAISGFVFGKGDIDRYCTFKLQLADSDPNNDQRAKYFMRDVIAWADYGLTMQAFEAKYNISDESCRLVIVGTTGS